MRHEVAAHTSSSRKSRKRNHSEPCALDGAHRQHHHAIRRDLNCPLISDNGDDTSGISSSVGDESNGVASGNDHQPFLEVIACSLVLRESRRLNEKRNAAELIEREEAGSEWLSLYCQWRLKFE